MSTRSPRLVALGVSAALATAGLALAAPTAASAAPVGSPSFLGYAYGSTVSANPAYSGQTSKLSVCGAVPNGRWSNNTAQLDLKPTADYIGAVTTTMTTTTDAANVVSAAAKTSLLGGLVQADAITATSNFRQSGTDQVPTGSTQISKLSILGLAATVPTGVNSKISIAGVADLYFNRQTTTKAFGLSQLTTEALRVEVLPGNVRGLPVGTTVIGSATAGVHSPTYARAAGTAYGSQIDLAGVVKSGQTAVVNLPCGGSDGAEIKNSIASLNVPKVLTVGAVSSTGQSLEGTGSTTSIMANRVGGINLLSGKITADAVAVKATSTRDSSGLKNSSAGTTVTNLAINGSKVDLGTGDNVVIKVDGVGSLTVRKTTPSSTGLDVVGLELKLDTDQFGYVAGTVIQVAVAKSRVVTN